MISLVVFGETGTGKSTLGNTLVGSTDGTVFPESDGVDAHTYETRAHLGEFCSQPVKVTDTPGLGESTDLDARHLVNMAHVITSDDTIQAFVIVLNYHNPRFEDRERKLFELLIKMFPGAPWYSHVAVVWSHFFSWMPPSMKANRTSRETGVNDKLVHCFGSIAPPEMLKRIPHFFVDSLEARKPGNESQRELTNLLAWIRTCKRIKDDLPTMRVPDGPATMETRTRIEVGETRTDTWRGQRRYHICGPRAHHGNTFQTQTVITEQQTLQKMTDGTVESGPWKEVSRSSAEKCIAHW